MEWRRRCFVLLTVPFVVLFVVGDGDGDGNDDAEVETEAEADMVEGDCGTCTAAPRVCLTSPSLDLPFVFMIIVACSLSEREQATGASSLLMSCTNRSLPDSNEALLRAVHLLLGTDVLLPMDANIVLLSMVPLETLVAL